MAEAERKAPLRGRLAALAILAALLGAAAWNLLAPVAEAAGALAEVRERLERRATALEAPVANAAYDPAEMAARHGDDAEAQLALQALIDRRARAALLGVEAVRPAGSEALGELGRATWVEASLAGDLQAVVDFLSGLDQERPLVLVRALELEAGFGERPDAALRIRIEAGRAWRGEGP